MWLCFPVKIEEHDHIKKEYHNGTRIYNNVHDGEELCVHKNIVTRDAEECDDQIEDTVDGIARNNHHNCRQYGQEREEIEEVKRHVTYYGLAACAV